AVGDQLARIGCMEIQESKQSAVSCLVSNVVVSRRLKDDHRMIVGVKCRVAGEPAQSLWPSDQTAEQLKLIHECERFQLRHEFRIADPLSKPIGSISDWVGCAHQTEHGGVHSQPEKVAASVRKNFKERSHDHLEHRLVELEQWQPLTKQPAPSQTLANRLEMFAGIKRSGTIACRMEKIGDDHVIAGLSHSDE